MKIVAYESKFGKYTLPEGAREKLQGLPIEEQLTYFRTTEWANTSRTGWGERREGGTYCCLEEDSYVLGVIVDGGLVVGAMLRNDCGSAEPCFVGERVCTYSSCDNNGAGYIERDDYTYLLLFPEKEEL